MIIDQIYDTNSSALIFLTVYPASGIDLVTENDIDLLAEQCRQLTIDSQRSLVIRLAPEMNGNWNLWGQRPSAYVAFWRRLHNAVKAKAPKTAFAWAPSSSNGCMKSLLNNRSIWSASRYT